MKLLFIPYLLVALGVTIVYWVGYYLFYIKWDIIPVKEELVNYIFPFGACALAVLVFLRRRVHCLQIASLNGGGTSFYQLLFMGYIAVPLIIGLAYIDNVSYTLVKLHNVSQVKNKTDEKFFKIDTFTLQHAKTATHTTVTTTGKNNQFLKFTRYVAVPFAKDNNVWYALQFSKQVYNNRDSKENQKAYYSFIKSSKQQLEAYNFNTVTYFKKEGVTQQHDNFLEAVKSIESKVLLHDQVFLVPQTMVYSNRNTGLETKGILAFGITTLLAFLMISIPKINRAEHKRYQNKKPLKNDFIKEEVLTYLNPKGPNKATAFLGAANVLVFVVMVLIGANIFSPTAELLLRVGGMRYYEVANGQVWRLFTSMFIHGGLPHLVYNLVGLFVVGVLLEKALGVTRYLALYVVTGIIASVCSIYFNGQTVSVGASGAIFGLYGFLFAVELFHLYPNAIRKGNWSILLWFPGASLVIGFAMPGVDNAAHLGGLLSGFAIGLAVAIRQGKSLKIGRK